MAWIYLAESGDSALPYHRGSSLGPIAKKSRMPKLSYCPECGTALFHGLQSGTMCEVCLSEWSGLRLTLSTGDSPARTSVLQELKSAWMESDPNSCFSSSDWFASYDQASSSWKTRQDSFPWASNEFTWSSLRWGLISGGRLSQPEKWEPVTCARDGGFVPTPVARDYKSPGISRTRKASIEDRRGVPLTVWFKETFKMNLFPGFVEWMMGYAPKHTVLEPWATQWCRSKRAKRS